MKHFHILMRRVYACQVMRLPGLQEKILIMYLKPLFVLMRLLDRHPELVRELQAINECADINALLVQKQQQREN